MVLQKSKNTTLSESEQSTKARTVAFVGIMAALANVMSFPPLAVPLQLGTFSSSIHFFQLAIFVCAILAGPWAGLLSGAMGSLYMGATRIPFVVGGTAIVGACVGILGKKMRPTIACLLAWLIQAPYVFVTDYVWFAYFLGNSQVVTLSLLVPIMVNLGLQALVCALFADVIVHFTKKNGIAF